MKPTSHVWRWTLLFAIGAGLLLFGCSGAPEPDPEPNEPELSSVDTDATGLAEIPDTEMRVKVLDGLTGEPLTGMRVSAIIAPDQSDAIIFVEDPDSTYAPTATSWSELEDAAGVSRAQATTIIPTILMSTDEDAWTMFQPPPELMEWWESVAYDCTINTLDRIQAEAAPDLQEFVGSFVRDGFIELAMKALVPGYVIYMKVYSAEKMADFIADAWISFMLATYRWQGYEGGEAFRICYKNHWKLGIPSPGPIAYWEPLSPPSSIDQRLSGLFGVVRDAASANPIAGADVYISGPDFRSTRTNAAGEYEFENLPTGDYEVLIRRLGYYRELASVSLGQESRFRDFTIAPFGGPVAPGANVAVPALGATTAANGRYAENTRSDLAIDGDDTTYWAGSAAVSPQMMWVNFNATHRINRIVVHELSFAYINSGLLEYYDGSAWQPITTIQKPAAGFEVEFATVNASAVRLTVYSNTSPPTWGNKVACITGLEVYTAP